MTSTTRNRKTNARPAEPQQPMEQAQELAQQAVDRFCDYARKNPGSAALWCLGIGFVLGWKLKP